MAHETGNWTHVCAESEISAEAAFEVVHGDFRIALYQLEDGIYATDNICPHAFALMSDGWLEEDVIECPLHGALFDVRSGEVKRGPAECNLRTFLVRVDAGQVFVKL